MTAEQPTRLEQQAAQLFDTYAEAHTAHVVTRPIASRAIIAAAFLSWDRGDVPGSVVFDEEMQKRGITSELALQTAKERRTILREALADTSRIMTGTDEYEAALQRLIDQSSA